MESRMKKNGEVGQLIGGGGFSLCQDVGRWLQLDKGSHQGGGLAEEFCGAVQVLIHKQ